MKHEPWPDRLCAIDLAGEPAGHRSRPPVGTIQALPHRVSREGGPLYADQPLGFELDGAVYALNSTTIDLCLSVFPWARFRSRKGAVKMHTRLDVRGSIPTFIEVSDGKTHDVNILDQTVPEPGSFYVMDRAYVDFERRAVRPHRLAERRCLSQTLSGSAAPRSLP